MGGCEAVDDEGGYVLYSFGLGGVCARTAGGWITTRLYYTKLQAFSNGTAKKWLAGPQER